jgi:hypothetical protein
VARDSSQICRPVTLSRPGPHECTQRRGLKRRTTLAQLMEAMVGGDTHRDTHEAEMIAPNGTTIATLAVGHDDDGFAEAVAWIAEHARVPGWRSAWGEPGATAPAWPAPRRPQACSCGSPGAEVLIVSVIAHCHTQRPDNATPPHETGCTAPGKLSSCQERPATHS